MFDFLCFNVLEFILGWYPWLNFFSDVWILQFFIIYILFLMFSSINVYYVLLYMFVEIFLFGLFISSIQMELFTGFLWVVECTVIFIALLLLFYLNVEGNQIKFNLKTHRTFFGYILVILFYFTYSYIYPSNFEFYLSIIFNNIDLYDDYYEALYNTNMNDFRSLTVAYYSVNNMEFIIIGLILLIGSVVCVNLNKLQKNVRLQNYFKYLSIFNYYKDFTNYTFIRKQNLMSQTMQNINIRVFKKK